VPPDDAYLICEAARFILLSWWLDSLGESPTFFRSSLALGTSFMILARTGRFLQREMSWTRSTTTLIVQLLLHACSYQSSCSLSWTVL
jgi:hypothetical protein